MIEDRVAAGGIMAVGPVEHAVDRGDAVGDHLDVVLAHIDRGWMVWDGSAKGNEDAARLRTVKPKDAWLTGAKRRN